ncbi:MAG TPA: SUMF1/EgtB/PvdO family nonheme iron enzyme [Nitrospirales bacterium]|nr:ergothioneine biosynthesis protein EgtB [Nitrospiraceae bacterium]HNP30208.1 SUMF1/EgtB/PvdO family nonheme iron enzyme [Nitrospirales bacterium]
MPLATLQRELDEARSRTDRLFSLMSTEAMYERPIPERHRLIFYLGHLEAFDWNQICRWTAGKPSFHESFDQLFEAGIDPSVGNIPADQPSDWPRVNEVQRYKTRAREEVDRMLAFVPECIIHVAIEHRLMHAETNAYLLHHLDLKHKPSPADPSLGCSLSLTEEMGKDDMVEIPEGMATLGMKPDDGFGWDNEFAQHKVPVPNFLISRYKVTNQQYLRFVQDGGEPSAFWVKRGDAWYVRTMFQEVPLPQSWPVYVTHRQAQAYANWAGMALPTEAQFHRAAFGSPYGIERSFPWGDEAPMVQHGNFNFQAWDPVPVTAHSSGNSGFGVAQLMGNGWEWTSTLFHPFVGFSPIPTYPGYSARFFDQDHYVVKGGGPHTAGRLLRRSFRNWFRKDYSHAHIGFRCVQS